MWVQQVFNSYNYTKSLINYVYLQKKVKSENKGSSVHNDLYAYKQFFVSVTPQSLIHDFATRSVSFLLNSCIILTLGTIYRRLLIMVNLEIYILTVPNLDWKLALQFIWLSWIWKYSRFNVEEREFKKKKKEHAKSKEPFFFKGKKILQVKFTNEIPENLTKIII